MEEENEHRFPRRNLIMRRGSQSAQNCAHSRMCAHFWLRTAHYPSRPADTLPPGNSMDTAHPAPSPMALRSAASTLLFLGGIGPAPLRLFSAPPGSTPSSPTWGQPCQAQVYGSESQGNEYAMIENDSLSPTFADARSRVLPPEFFAAFPPLHLREKSVSKRAYSVRDLSEDQRSLLRALKENVLPRVMREYLRMDRRAFNRVLEGKHSATMGRPPCLDAPAVAEVREQVINAKAEKKAMTKHETLDVMASLSRDTAARRNVPLAAAPSAKLLCKNAARARIKFGKGQKTTTARWREGRDLRNMATMAAANSLYGDVPMQLMGNVDATAFVVDFDEERLLAYVEDAKPSKSKGKKKAPVAKKQAQALTRVGPAVLGVYVKVFTLMSASGYVSTTFLMDDPSLGPEAFVHFPVQGLSMSIDPKSSSEMCFCFTRQGNLAFFSFLFGTVVPSFEESMRQLAPKGSRAAPFYLIIDGEETQSAVMQSDTLRTMLDFGKVVVVKGPASCSGQCGNPADMGNFFKAWKSSMRGAIVSLDNTDEGLTERLQEAMADPTQGLKLAAARIRKITSSLVRIVKSGAHVADIPRVIREGFSFLGLYPLDVSRTLQCCSGNYSPTEMETTRLAIPKLAELMLANGQITETEMDDLGIPRSEDWDENVKDKDERPQQNQRALVLTHQSARDRRRRFLDQRQAKKDAATKRAAERAVDGRAPKRVKGGAHSAGATAPDNTGILSTPSSSAPIVSALFPSSSSPSEDTMSAPSLRGRNKRLLSTVPQVGDIPGLSVPLSTSLNMRMDPYLLSSINEEKSALFRRETREAKRVREATEAAAQKATEKAAQRTQKRKEKTMLPPPDIEQQLEKLNQQAARLEKKRALLQAQVSSSSSSPSQAPPS